MTVLLPLDAPFATVTIGAYEPIVTEWIGFLGAETFRAALAIRDVPSGDPDRGGGADVAPTIVRFRWDPTSSGAARPGAATIAAPSTTSTARDTAARAERTIAPIFGRNAKGLGLPQDERQRRKDEIRRIFEIPDLAPDRLLGDLRAAGIPDVTDEAGLHRELSPLGIVHFLRQLYFDGGAGVGPIEQVVGLAPSETLEIFQEVSRRRAFERVQEIGSSVQITEEEETSVQDEISELTQFSVLRDVNVGVSASAHGGLAGVFSAGGSFSLDLAVSTEQARELTRRRMLEETRRSEQIARRSHRLTIRSQEDVLQRSTVRRLVRNDGEEPVNYALRRVLRTIRVKLQDLGPQLVWQLYVCNPGARLVPSKFVVFQEGEDIVPDTPPGAPPRPGPSTSHGTQTLAVVDDAVVLSLPRDPQRDIQAVTVDNVFDIDPGKRSDPPALADESPQRLNPEDDASPYDRWQIPLDRGGAKEVSVSYTVHYLPSEEAIDTWNQSVRDAREQYEAALREQEFERAKRLIEARSRVLPRPAVDLRREERYEILNRMISEAFREPPARGLPSPVEIESFHRLFNVEALFYYVHPSWWRPRFSRRGGAFEITDESAPAPFGASLGWAIQPDGDRRRNEFLNSPYLRACIPIRRGREREAADWIAEHFEGKRGYRTEPGTPIGDLLAAMEQRRAEEAAASPGPDYVTVAGEPAPEAVVAYPVVDEFEILQPTEGFVYERLRVET